MDSDLQNSVVAATIVPRAAIGNQAQYDDRGKTRWGEGDMQNNKNNYTSTYNFLRM